MAVKGETLRCFKVVGSLAYWLAGWLDGWLAGWLAYVPT
jgi:hypothetical protein